MPLKPPQPPPANQRDWDRWARSVDVVPDDGTITTEKIVDNAVTNEKLRNSAALSVIGNPTGSEASPQDIAAGSDGHFLRRSGGAVGFGAIADADIPSSIARDTEVTTAISNHESAPDPHPSYQTAAEVTSAVNAGISAHEGAADPHPGYTTAAELSSAIAALNLTSGAYAPTGTGITNVAALTTYDCNYLRVGSVVTVSGRVDIDATATGNTVLVLTLPIETNFTSANQLAGVAANHEVSGHSAAIFADTGGERAQFQFNTTDTANRAMFFTFTYIVL